MKSILFLNLTMVPKLGRTQRFKQNKYICDDLKEKLVWFEPIM